MTTDRTNVAPLARHDNAAASRRVFVRDLEVMAEIGIHAHEIGCKQPIVVSLDLDVNDNAAPLGDMIDTVLNYEGLVQLVETTVGRGHINLVETLAELLAAGCLEDPRTLSVTVRIEKPQAFANARAVGVELTCRRSL